MSAETADNAGTPQLKQFHMVNIKTKFPRGINSDQVISANKLDGDMKVRAPGPGLKRQATSLKRQAFEPTCSSSKPQATSPEAQASSFKPQATSSMIRVPRYKNTEEVFLGKGPWSFTIINVFLG